MGVCVCVKIGLYKERAFRSFCIKQMSFKYLEEKWKKESVSSVVVR